MKLGTHIKLPNGAVGTVVYNSLDGIGIKWGLHNPDPSEFENTCGNLFDSESVPNDWPWEPDAILRSPWPGCEKCGWEKEQCVGEEFERIND